MKVSVLQENLTKGLSHVGRIVPARSTLPVLSNILLTAEQNRLKLSATNLEEGINCWIGAKVEREGAITVPARLLIDFVGSLPNERIDMELTIRTQSLHLECAQSQANIKGIDAQDFPPIPTVRGEPTLRVEPQLFRAMINQVALVAAPDDSRPILTGMLASFEPSRITLAAADGFRLAARSEQVSTALEEPVEIIVPARAMQELARILADQTEPVEALIAPNRGQVLFHVDDIDLISQCIDGQFPNYKQIIPQQAMTRTVVDTQSLLSAVRRASPFARDSANIIRLQMSPGGELSPGLMVVSATADQVGDNTSQLVATVDGDEAQIAFNSKYLIDALTVMNAAQVALETNTPSSPGLFRPVSKDDYIHLIMPMHTQR